LNQLERIGYLLPGPPENEPYRTFCKDNLSEIGPNVTNKYMNKSGVLAHKLLGIHSLEALRRSHSEWGEEALARAEQVREGKWTESVAVGSGDFVESIKAKLGVRAKGRKIFGTDGESSLLKPLASYSDDFNA
jgi:hypothetical protein